MYRSCQLLHSFGLGNEVWHKAKKGDDGHLCDGRNPDAKEKTPEHDMHKELRFSHKRMVNDC